MSYEVEFASKRVVKQYEQLPSSAQGKVADAIRSLKAFPAIGSSVKLAGYPSHYRIRVGDYRVVVMVDEGKRKVVILLILHRREVYQKLKQLT